MSWAQRGRVLFVVAVAGAAACGACAPPDPGKASGDAARSQKRDAARDSSADAARTAPTDAAPALDGKVVPTDARPAVDATPRSDADPADARSPIDGASANDAAPAPEGAATVLYSVPNSEPAFGIVAVDDAYVYWTRFGGSLLRLHKDGTGEPQVLLTQGAGGTSVSMVVQGGNLYWPQSDRVTKLDLASLAVSYLPIGATLSVPSMVGDAQALYVGSAGCNQMASVPLDGSAPSVAELAVTPQFPGGVVAVAQDESHVYCTAGGLGIMYRRAKSGGEIERVTVVPDPDDIYNQQVGGMAVVGETVYFIIHYGSLSRRWHFLASVPRTGGDATVITKIDDASQVSSIHHDPARKALYWLALSQPEGMIRFDLTTSEISRRPLGLPLATGAMAADADHLYVIGSRALGRIAKW